LIAPVGDHHLDHRYFRPADDRLAATFSSLAGGRAVLRVWRVSLRQPALKPPWAMSGDRHSLSHRRRSHSKPCCGAGMETTTTAIQAAPTGTAAMTRMVRIPATAAPAPVILTRALGIPATGMEELTTRGVAVRAADVPRISYGRLTFKTYALSRRNRFANVGRGVLRSIHTRKR